MADVQKAFDILIEASRAAKMDWDAHGECAQAGREIAEALNELSPKTAKIAELTEQVRVSQEERGYFEKLAFCLADQCLENQVNTLKALEIPAPDSIKKLEIVDRIAPEK